ncbi:ABC transporter substrate-binding protein [Streptomyces viridochromogenes]|uniref:ABC transporter substrate-binding protein n=1 Tax=Streptomyces viridochromogenes TaxID=1938 RepID=A0A0J8CD29_STRVR|nr:substrate-binding domain-containing protein [Streptomyces viridochromogenes]KMS75785.1 ABC transporter substrate-binding protein [Streptomyces viridochromogenes]KOG16985.1 ABC transporter substrate-binding protein [Streptomyces viridochromogenes]KOG18093.1 ABC transporter substrate-binding protein [Streptomyces viridochromogenes]
MRTRTLHVVAALVAGLMTASLAACGEDDGAGAESFTVGLLLPNRVTPRWEHSDKPLIEQRLKELCADCTMVYANAENDAARQRQQVISMITNGAKVLILDPADSRAVRSSIQEAKRAGVPVIAYDRLAEGPISGFVSFDGAQVGRLQGEALLKAMDERGRGRTVVMMNGDPSSANAAWFREGAMSVISGKAKIARSYDTAGWSPENAHANMSAAISALGADRIDGVVAANDAIAAGVISAFKNAGVKDLPPITGQDADLEAVRRIVKGEQYMTVYKPFEKEAAAAAAMAVAVGRDEGADGVATTTTDSPTTKDIPSILLTPKEVTADNVRQTLINEGRFTVEQICVRPLRAACAEIGLTG